MIFEPIENANVNVMKHVQYEIFTHMGYRFINKVAELFHSIEEEYKNMSSSEKNKVDHLEISSKLLDLANIEDENNDNNNLSIFLQIHE